MPQRMFAHCPATGCNTRKPFMVSVFQGEPSMRDENGLPFDPRRAHFWPTTAMRKPMERRGIWCAEHGPMRVYELKATFNPDRKCDGRCTHAKRPQCDCSCNGANHGSEV